MEGHLDYLIEAYAIAFALFIGYRLWIARQAKQLLARQRELEQAGAKVETGE